MRKEDLTGKVFGKLTVISKAEPYIKPYGRYSQWLCLCNCGKKGIHRENHLKAGWAKSCGCVKTREFGGGWGRRTTGMSKTKEHGAWRSMIYRCSNPKAKGYPHYGGRGITVCDQWKNDFFAFMKDMGTCPDGKSLDRIDNDGNYEPENCRWATVIEQNNNMRRPRTIYYPWQWEEHQEAVGA
jgi:hypothetical protein